jgi:hypothetical protein
MKKQELITALLAKIARLTKDERQSVFARAQSLMQRRKPK